jgi:multidrug efflux system outer membrane protein
MSTLQMPRGMDVSRIAGSNGRWILCTLLLLALSGCSDMFPTLDLSPPYQPPEYVVPASWHGASPFIEASPSDGELRPDWWTLYDDPVLNNLIDQAMAANPDLEATAERFVQARDMMMRARSQYLPRLGLGFGASDNRASTNALFFPPGISQEASTVSLGGLASWEPDFWSALRNATRIETYRA